jgi:hypothetical protein
MLGPWRRRRLPKALESAMGVSLYDSHMRARAPPNAALMRGDSANRRAVPQADAWNLRRVLGTAIEPKCHLVSK